MSNLVMRIDDRPPPSAQTYRVWPDGTIQATEDGAAYTWMSDDYQLVEASCEDRALALAQERQRRAWAKPIGGAGQAQSTPPVKRHPSAT